MSILSHSRSLNKFLDSSYGSSVVVNVRATSVTDNHLEEKELSTENNLEKLESEKVINEKSTTSSIIDSKLGLSNVIVHTSDKNCEDFEIEREGEVIYSPVENYANTNNFYGEYHQPGDLSNWPYDLSRTRNRNTSIDYSVQYSNTEQQASDFRNPFNPYISAMKGNLMSICQFNDYLSPPSSVSSSSGYDLSDNNNNSFITIDQALHLSTIDDVIRDELIKENCFLVEDVSAGNYTTLTNAASSATPMDLYHIHDYQRNYGTHNHSTSSGGDSRSPDGYTNEEYENGMSFTQLTNLSSRSNGIYASSPNPVTDHNILSYESHVLSPTRWVIFYLIWESWSLVKASFKMYWRLSVHSIGEWTRWWVYFMSPI